jgi:hypothetical protein
MSVLAYWNSLLLELKIIRAISQSHRMLNSYAFFIRPNFLLVNVTWQEKLTSEACIVMEVGGAKGRGTSHTKYFRKVWSNCNKIFEVLVG